MAVKNNLGSLVFFHRKQAGLSRVELATLAGVGKTVIYDLEKGKQTVRWDTIMAILETLNIDLDWNSPLKSLYEKSLSKTT